MKHLISIIWLISWPVLIYATYWVSQIALRMLDKELKKSKRNK
ncbi:MAG: hypothetical protein PHE03_13825 [Bacteroidales bacterium]|nr:hypothetical protein [Bacteroidales bacterium]MDD3893365.1 hypothetical protein [Bacteroidales bacterium]